MLPGVSVPCENSEAAVKTGRILILRGGALGDVILTLPLFRAIRDAWPRAFIELAAYAPQGRLAVESGLADRLIPLDDAAFAEWFGDEAALSPAQRDRIGSFDLIVCLLHDPDGRLERMLRRVCPGRVIGRSPLVTDRHASDHFLAVAQTLGIPPPLSPPRLDLPAVPASTDRVIRLPPGAVVLHPGSGSAAKNWPLSGFMQLARILDRARPGAPLWFLGEAEADTGGRLEESGNRFPVLRGLPIVEVARLLAKAGGYIGNDSGITHLAAVTGIPTVALFGPTDPALWAPRGERVAVLRADPPTSGGLRGLAPERVAAAFFALDSSLPRR